MKWICTLAVALSLVAANHSQAGPVGVWNAAADFTNQNPSGQWSYGYDEGSNLLDEFVQSPTLGDIWQHEGTDGYFAIVRLHEENLYIQGAFAYHAAILRWTAPTDGLYSVSLRIEYQLSYNDYENGGTEPDVTFHSSTGDFKDFGIGTNPNPDPDQDDPPIYPVAEHSVVLNLAAGDTLELVNSPNFFEYTEETEVRVFETITAVNAIPLPPAVIPGALMLAGIAAPTLRRLADRRS